MKNIIQSIFRKFGFEIYKIETEKPKIFDQNQKPFLVEFIGTSGVGKSYFFERLKKTNGNRIELNKFLKTNHKLLNNKLLSENQFYQNIAREKLNDIQKRETDNIDKLGAAVWGFRHLKDDAVIMQNIENQIIITEEGLLHNFRTSIMNAYGNVEIFPELLTKKRAVVYCYTSDNVIAERIQKREKETGVITAGHREKSFEELMNYAKKEILEMNGFIIFLQKIGISVITIDTNEDVTGNITKVNDFIHKLATQ